MSETEFLQRAIELAMEYSADGLHGPFGAVIVCADRIVAEGWNGVIERVDPTAHAEIVALRAACRELGRIELADCTLYSSCKPCPMCLAAAYWAHIPRIVFAASAKEAEQAGFLDQQLYDEFRAEDADKKIELVQIELANRAEPFERWLNNPQRHPY
jgi:tRNA(Arg) A34 adenosine deaminase TadA